jgi:hypothetical protein
MQEKWTDSVRLSRVSRETWQRRLEPKVFNFDLKKKKKVRALGSPNNFFHSLARHFLHPLLYTFIYVVSAAAASDFI